MATRMVRLSERAWSSLTRLKQGRETFSDVVERLTAPHDLRQLVGILSEAEGEQLAAAVAENRRISARQSEERQRRLWSD